MKPVVAAEILCPIDNRPCPHLTMLEGQKDAPIPEQDIVAEVLGEVPYAGSCETDVTHEFNRWQPIESPIFIEANVTTGRKELLGWNPFQWFENVKKLTQRTEVAESCASRALTECGVVVHVLDRNNK